MSYRLIRPVLFSLPPETAHTVTFAGLQCAYRLGLLARVAASPSSDPVTFMGLRFPNRLGLAAGLDKNATCIDPLGALGFGFVEVGTITPRPQAGNAGQRLFRLSQDRALINRMGFPNDGAEAVCKRLSKRHYRGICGVNIGKNADTPLHDSASDYVTCLTAAYPHADYVVINISSPNTAELRRLQQGELLRRLLTTLLEARAALAREYARHIPILIKLAADLDSVELSEAARVSMRYGIDGIVASNTSVSRIGLTDAKRTEAGGLSGAPLLSRALSAVQCIRAEVGTSFLIIGVGGIDSAKEAVAMRAAGADLLQLYTGLIYRGPALIREILASQASA